MKKVLPLFFLLLSCEKEIKIHLAEANERLVVEGFIQPEFPPYVILSKTQGVFASNSNQLEDIYVNNALVYVEREDGIRHQLTFINQDIIDSLFPSLISLNIPFPGFFIDLDPNYKDFSQSGYRYKLEIEWNNQDISSSTYIPLQQQIDSLWCSCEEEEEYNCFIYAQINDPDTLGNNLFIEFKRKTYSMTSYSLFNKTARSIRSDLVFNGESFPMYFARSGKFSSDKRLLLPFLSERIIDGQVLVCDDVILRISHIDNTTYKFWRSLERVGDSNGNPFSEPMNLVGNVNGALGIWGGYGASYYRMPIVKDTVIFDVMSIDPSNIHQLIF